MIKNIVRALLICTMVSGLYCADADNKAVPFKFFGVPVAICKGQPVELQRATPGAFCAWITFNRERTEWIKSIKAFPNCKETKTALGLHAFYAMGVFHIKELHQAGADFFGPRKKAIDIVHKGASEEPETEWSPMHAAAYYACVLKKPKASLEIMLYLSSKVGVPLNHKVGEVTTEQIVDTYAEKNSSVAWLLGQYKLIQESGLPRVHFENLGLTGKEWCGVEGVEFDPDAFYENRND